MTSRKNTTLAALALIAVAATWGYAPALRGQFQFDDEIAITRNPAIKDLGAFLRHRFVQGYAGDGRPVTDLSFALNYSLTGLDPVPLHLTNVAIHLAAALLAFALARLLFRGTGLVRADGCAVAVAAIFALHPLQTEAVSYLCQRAESLASLLYLATILMLLASERLPWRWRGALAYLAAIGLFVLAMGAKPIAATVPVAFLLCAICLEAPGRITRGRALRLALRATPFLLLGAASALANTLRFRGRPDVGFDMPQVTAREYLLTQPRAILGYLRLFFWPSGLSIDHDLPVSRGWDAPTIVAAAALAGVAATGAWLLLRGRRSAAPEAPRDRLAGLGLLWFLTVLLPTSSVIPFADVMVEHRVYLPLFGLALSSVALVSSALAVLPSGSRRWVAPGLALGCSVALALSLQQRNRVWSSQVALWRDAAEKAPLKQRPHVNYAHVLHLARRDEEAVVEFRRALALPFDGSILPYLVHANLATSLLNLERPGEAAKEIGVALELRPGDPELWNDLAICLLREGQLDPAMQYARRALARAPEFGGARVTVGQILMERGDYGGALAEFQAALRQDPDAPGTLYNLAHVLVLLGRTQEACAALDRYGRVPQGSPEEALEKEQALGCLTPGTAAR